MILVKYFIPNGETVIDKIKGESFIINAFGMAEIFHSNTLCAVVSGFASITKEDDNA